MVFPGRCIRSASLRPTDLPIRLIRVPSRFSLLAGVFGAVLAAAGLRHLSGRLRSRAARAGVFGLLGVATVADLGNVPFRRFGLPEMPDCYAFLKRLDPNAAILEVPFSGSGGTDLNLACRVPGAMLTDL